MRPAGTAELPYRAITSVHVPPQGFEPCSTDQESATSPQCFGGLLRGEPRNRTRWGLHPWLLSTQLPSPCGRSPSGRAPRRAGHAPKAGIEPTDTWARTRLVTITTRDCDVRQAGVEPATSNPVPLLGRQMCGRQHFAPHRRNGRNRTCVDVVPNHAGGHYPTFRSRRVGARRSHDTLWSWQKNSFSAAHWLAL